MGRILVEVEVANADDETLSRHGHLPVKKVRRLTVANALVDTGAALLCLPPKTIRELGLHFNRKVKVRTANGIVSRRIFGGVKATLQNRTVELEVMESDSETPPLVGYLVLEAMDFVANPVRQRLEPNPASKGGKWTADLY